MNEIELKPCPFCGGSNIDQYQIGNEWTKKRAYEIKCKTFGCCTTRKVGVITQSLEWAKQKCIERWNARALEARQAAEIKRLREALDSARAAIEYDDNVGEALGFICNALKSQESQESEVQND